MLSVDKQYCIARLFTRWLVEGWEVYAILQNIDNLNPIKRMSGSPYRTSFPLLLKKLLLFYYL